MDKRLLPGRTPSSLRAALLLLLALAGLPPLAAEAQQPPRAPAAAPSGAPAAGGPGRILGTVAGPDEQPLGTVGVTLRAASDSSVVTGVLTDPAGRFRIEGLPEGSYLLHVARIGYVSRSSETIELTGAAPEVNLGTIVLQISAVAVDGVEGLADRPAVVIEADRTVYDVRSLPVAGAGTTTDVLRSIPELEVDVEDRVRTRGNQPAAIHLNGRPLPLRGDELAAFLRQLPGDQLERIEVLPNPSARHDPDGLGGIVNIVLREDVEIGLSGSVNVNASSRGRQAVGGRFNVQRGNLTLFSGASVNRMRMESESWSLRTNLITDPVTRIEQSSAMNNRGNGWNANWTAEYTVREGHVLWSNAFLFANTHGGPSSTAYAIRGEGEGDRERYDRELTRDGDMTNYNVQGGWKWIREPRREELSLDARRTTGGGDTFTRDARLFHILAGEPIDRPIELTLHDIESSNGNLSLQADYFRPVAGDGRLDVGYRAWWRDQDSRNLFEIFDTPQAEDPSTSRLTGYTFDEVFHSVYSTLALTRGPLRAQVGVRGEFATTEFRSRVVDETFEHTYRNLFPSANLSWEVRPQRILRLQFNRRISRPPAGYLDPFVPSTDPLNVFVGNPELDPATSETWTLDLSVQGNRGTLRMAPYATLSDGLWERIRTVDTEGVSTSRWENTANARQIGTNATLSLRPMGRLSGSANLGVYHEKRDGSNIRPGLENGAWMWRINGNVGVRLDDQSTVQVMASRFPMQAVLQGSASAYTFVSMSARRQIMDRRGSLSLSVSDPFNMNRFDSTVQDPTFLLESRSSNPSRMISLGFTLNLGQAPQQQSRPSSGPDGGGGETIRVP